MWNLIPDAVWSAQTNSWYAKSVPIPKENPDKGKQALAIANTGILPSTVGKYTTPMV